MGILNFYCRESWKRIALLYNSKTGEDRKPDALRKKWLEAANSKIPTGDPDIPEHIRVAKKLFKVADQVAEVGQGDPEDDDDSDESGRDSSYLNRSTQERSPSGVKIQDRKKRTRYVAQLSNVEDKFEEGNYNSGHP